jgi:hypothetical protein
MNIIQKTSRHHFHPQLVTMYIVVLNICVADGDAVINRGEWDTV